MIKETWKTMNVKCFSHVCTGTTLGYTREHVMNFCDKNLSTPLHVAVSIGDTQVRATIMKLQSQLYDVQIKFREDHKYITRTRVQVSTLKIA